MEIRASGMCGSDLKMFRSAGGPASLGFKLPHGPLVAGHEPCGVVPALGDVPYPVQMEPNLGVEYYAS